MQYQRLGLKVLIPVLLILCGTPARVATADTAVDDYNFAAWLYNNGKYDVAVGSYETFLKNHPTHEKVPDARFGLAQSLFQLNRYDEAMAGYEALRQDTPAFGQMAEVLFQLGQACVATKDFARAGNLFLEVRTSHAGHYLADWALARQGACLLSLDRFAEAEEPLAEFVARYAPDSRPPAKSDAVRQAFKKMGDGGPGAQQAFLGLIERSVFYLGIARFNASKFSEAQALFERFLALYANSELATEARFRLAQCLYRTDRFEEAVAAFTPVAGGDSPFAAMAAYERGLALYKMRKLKEAADALAEMATRFPADENAARAALHAGTFLYEGGDYAGATARLRGRTTRGLPFADEAAYWLGMSLLKGGQAAEAGTVFEQALKDHPKSSLAGDMLLGLADTRLAQENMAGAAGAFSDYADRFGKTEAAPQALYSACVALHRAEMYAESDTRCTAFLKQFKDHAQAPAVLFLSGENRFLRKEYDGAATRFREYLESKQDAADQRARAHFRLAWCHRHGRRYAEALAELDHAELKAADKAVASEALYVQGACLFDLERYAEAGKVLAAYLKADEHGRFADDAVLKMSVAQARTGDMARAVAGFERFLTLYPQSELAAQTRYQLAEGLFELKRYDKAARAYTQVLEQADATALHPFALLGLGMCAYEQGAWKEAAAHFSDLAGKYAKSDLCPQALFRQGQSLLKDNRGEEAEAAFLALVNGHAKHELVHAAWVAIGTSRQNRGVWEAAAEAFGQAAQSGGGKAEDQPRVLYELAWSYREAGREADSLQAFRDLAKAFPRDPLTADASFHLAEAKYKEAEGAGDDGKQPALQEAAALYRTVLDLTHDARLADKAWYRLGWCHWSCGDYAAAAEAFDALVKDYGQSELAPDALFQAGQAMAQGGRMAEARQRYEQLIGNRAYAGFQYLPEVHVALGEVLIAEGRLEEALKPLGKAMETGSEAMSATRAYFLTGKTLYQMGRYPEAATNFSTVTTRTRGALAAEAQFYLGQIEQAQDRFEQAIVAYLRVQAIYSANPEWVGGALLEMGKCHEALGRPEEARKLFRQVLKEFKTTQWAPLAQEQLGNNP
jgi:TolA-binding protein